MIAGVNVRVHVWLGDRSHGHFIRVGGHVPPFLEGDPPGRLQTALAGNFPDKKGAAHSCDPFFVPVRKL